MRCLVVIFSFVFFHVLDTTLSYETRTLACEHETLRLKCEHNKVIYIKEANYGRANASYCTHGPIQTKECKQAKAVSILEELCQGRNECAVHASNNVFGDPCVGTFKYLSVLYKCVEPEDHKYAQACEHEVTQLECAVGNVIQVVDANYGRLSTAGQCPKQSVHTTDCVAPTSTFIVSHACNGRQVCVILANNGVFGDPCVGTQKYLTINYNCVPDPEFTNRNEKLTCFDASKYACEDETMHLECSNNSTIKILDANYGKLSAKICPQNGVTRDIKCKSENSTQIVQSNCNGKQHCFMYASNDVFGDPCLGIDKYLEVQYVCESGIQIDAA